MPADTL